MAKDVAEIDDVHSDLCSAKKSSVSFISSLLSFLMWFPFFSSVHLASAWPSLRPMLGLLNTGLVSAEPSGVHNE